MVINITYSLTLCCVKSTQYFHTLSHGVPLVCVLSRGNSHFRVFGSKGKLQFQARLGVQTSPAELQGRLVFLTGTRERVSGPEEFLLRPLEGPGFL